MAVRRSAVMGLCAIALAGCAEWTPAPLSAETNGPYALDSGDRLRIVVFGQETLSNFYTVDAGGRITMPLIGAVAARGLSPEALSQATAVRLRQGYVREPHVAIEIETHRPFFVLGEVGTPGQFPFIPAMTAEKMRWRSLAALRRARTDLRLNCIA